MLYVLSFLKRLFSTPTGAVQDRDERYLAESTDIYDLERRIRELDSGRQSPYAVGSHGIFAR
jgi:hypothetical protein